MWGGISRSWFLRSYECLKDATGLLETICLRGWLELLDRGVESVVMASFVGDLWAFCKEVFLARPYLKLA